jgi:hypothetical protein
MARRHPRCGAGDAGNGGAVEIGGDTAGVGRHEGEDEADSQGPLDKETRGRQPARKAQTKRENVLPQIRHRRTGKLGRQGWLRPARGEGPAGPAGPKAEWAGKVSRAESEEEEFLN